MKKTLSFLISFLALGTLATMAQKTDYYKDNPHEIRLTAGSTISDDYEVNGYWYASNFYEYSNVSWSQNNYLRQAMQSGDKKASGAYGLTYFYHAPWINGRFTFGASLAYSRVWRDYNHRVTGARMGEERSNNFAITPMIRYAWVTKPIYQVYSGIGTSIYRGEYKYKEHLSPELETRQLSYSSWEASFMVTPIGFSVGKRVFGFGEVNIGGRMGEFVGGVGYRF